MTVGNTIGFGKRLADAFDTAGQLCVGIDPHGYLLAEWNLPDTALGAREFSLRVVDAAVGRAAIVKPQVAFFERFGAAGYSALEDVLAVARSAGLLVIADAKRGDVGSTVEAYGQAWLTPGSPLEADAMTISAYQGLGSLSAPMELAERFGKGLFVLAATSNPEAASLQTAALAAEVHRGKTVASSIVDDVIGWNQQHGQAIGSVGVVLGATVDLNDYGIRLDALSGTAASIDASSVNASSVNAATPILAPGFGHQGARYDRLGALFGPAAPFVVVSASRSILSAGPDGVAAAIGAQAREVAAVRHTSRGDQWSE
ncbi:MAG: pyrF [Microbacteriaceae bacterium]|nr:pyrF [Microbacteriaceae bacterium]